MGLKAIPDDYQPEEEYNVYPEGIHNTRPNADGVTLTWFSLNEETEEPILVGQPDGKLVGRCRLNVDEQGGPPMSVTLGEMALLVKAFGANVSELPAQPEISDAGAVTAYMNKVKELVDKTEKRVQIHVSDKGWIYKVKGMELPKTTLNWILVAVSRKDESGLPYKKTLEFGDVFWPTFRVVSSAGNVPTPYAGVEIQPLINYAVEQKGDTVDWQKNKGGSYTAAATRFNKLIRYTAPAIFEQDDFKPKHPENLLIDWQENLPEKPQVLSFNVDYNQKGYAEIIFATLSPAGYTYDKPVITNGETKPESKPVAKTENKPLDLIIQLVQHLADTKDVLKPDGTLNDAGLVVAKKYFSPLRAENKLTHSRFTEYGLEEAKAILDYALSQNADDMTIKKLRQELPANQFDTGKVDEECPF
jgi:hypothetical protein